MRVEGTVQGVGFRPYVYRLARELELGGHVLNDSRGVVVEAEGEPEAVDRLLERLPAEAPGLARVERVEADELPATGRCPEFAIVGSAGAGAGEPAALVSPDAATCPECLAELFDPADRRHRYPFVNCTACGPRFTIVRGVPYDRPLTTMAGFEMCGSCRAEYDDPRDRRFHAQPNACPECGPVARLVDGRGRVAEEPDAVAAAARALLAGAIVAVKGIGGFHLACRADDEQAVGALRGRKHREQKPFALMAPDLAGARELVELTAAEEDLLLDRSRPVVLAARRPSASVAPGVAPRSRELGVMLPYSPLHHLLLADARTPLVMTSANVSDEPIAYRDEDALERLAAIADLFLLHDRPIETRTDDSVVRSVATPPRPGGERPLVLRRSRGAVPATLELPVPAEREVLACGAELKSTFCLAKGARAFVGHHIGDLKNLETLTSFREGVAHFERLFAVEPTVVAHDLHPDYLSTRYALEERTEAEHVTVQHHHAHLAACLAEHGRDASCLGAIFDGTGLGLDGAVWGGELLVGGLASFDRAGHLWPVRMPGGERAIREPWRMACAWLVAALDEEEPALPPALADEVADVTWHQVAKLARTGLASPVTTSVGRLFDAVAALCGFGARVTYEGQAAIELEAAASASEERAYPLPVLDRPDGGPLLLDARETVRAVAREAADGISPALVSARFHNALAEATARALVAVAERTGVGTVVLSGGVFANRRLLEGAAARLAGSGLEVLVPERLPPGDGGISFGQAAVAAARTAGLGGAGAGGP